jgi:hypothetical protein
MDKEGFNNCILKWTNHKRHQHLADPVGLDDGLRRSSQKFADKLAKARISDIDAQHSSAADIEIRYPNSGESLAMLSFSGSIDNLCLEVSRAWYNQVNAYDFVGITETGFHLDTHSTEYFTQWVWRATTHMGCGIAKDSDENTIVVCQYTPKGNYQSNDFDYPYGPYIDNVKPIPWDVCNTLLIPDPVVWPPIEGEIVITEEMCRRFHLAYIQAGEAEGARIIGEATMWSETTRAEAWEYS